MGCLVIVIAALAVAGFGVVTGVTTEESSPVVSPAAELTPAAELQVSEQRLIDLPDTRLISMSPDGRWLVAAQPAAGYQQRQLCVYAVATQAEQACGDLAPLEAGLRIEDVVWSPDGSRLAFTERAFESLVDGDLWVMDAVTGAVTNVDDDAFSGELPVSGGASHEAPISVPVAPAFAPDGGTVAFSRSLVVDGEWAGNEIALVPAEGGTSPRTLVRVTDEAPGVVYYGMRWAPDGARLFYAVHDSDRANPDNGIWVVDADGRNARHVLGTTDPDLGPPSVAEVSPRGDTLLAFYPIGAAQFPFGADTYALVDLTRGAAVPVTLQDPDVPEPAYVSLAAFSPDGSKLLYTARLTDPDNQVLVRDVEGGEEVRLAEELPGVIGVALGIGPTWATDGTIFIPAGGTLSTGTLLVVD